MRKQKIFNSCQSVSIHTIQNRPEVLTFNLDWNTLEDEKELCNYIFKILFSIPEIFYTDELFKATASKKQAYVFKGMTCRAHGKDFSFFRRTDLKHETLAARSRKFSYEGYKTQLELEIDYKTEWVLYNGENVSFMNQKNWFQVICMCVAANKIPTMLFFEMPLKLEPANETEFFKEAHKCEFIKYANNEPFQIGK